jgi:hypothetical protein
MEVTASGTNTHRRIGLSNGDTNQSWDDIDFCLYLSADGAVYINEGVTPRGKQRQFASTDSLLVTDQLGTPRMIFEQSGSLANVSRHDCLPFGEELFANVGGRSTSQGYTNSDGARQKFTQYERDNETGLDYSINRY